MVSSNSRFGICTYFGLTIKLRTDQPMLMKANAAVRLTENTSAEVPIALVIGSGFGGLAAAVRLAAKGW